MFKERAGIAHQRIPLPGVDVSQLLIAQHLDHCLILHHCLLGRPLTRAGASCYIHRLQCNRITPVEAQNLISKIKERRDILRKSERKVADFVIDNRSEEHTSELQSRPHLVCRLLLEKKKNKEISINI